MEFPKGEAETKAEPKKAAARRIGANMAEYKRYWRLLRYSGLTPKFLYQLHDPVVAITQAGSMWGRAESFA